MPRTADVCLLLVHMMQRISDVCLFVCATTYAEAVHGTYFSKYGRVFTPIADAVAASDLIQNHAFIFNLS